MASKQIAFFNYGHSYAASALALSLVNVDATHPHAPVGFLCFHAIELYLKSYLLAHGLTEQELRKRKYGHNLCCLANEAKNRGLAIDEKCDEVILHLSVTDNIISSRYIRTGHHSHLTFADLYDSCCRLHTAIVETVYPDSVTQRRPRLAAQPTAHKS